MIRQRWLPFATCFAVLSCGGCGNPRGGKARVPSAPIASSSPADAASAGCALRAGRPERSRGPLDRFNGGQAEDPTHAYLEDPRFGFYARGKWLSDPANDWLPFDPSSADNEVRTPTRRVRVANNDGLLSIADRSDNRSWRAVSGTDGKPFRIFGAFDAGGGTTALFGWNDDNGPDAVTLLRIDSQGKAEPPRELVRTGSRRGPRAVQAPDGSVAIAWLRGQGLWIARADLRTGQLVSDPFALGTSPVLEDYDGEFALAVDGADVILAWVVPPSLDALRGDTLRVTVHVFRQVDARTLPTHAWSTEVSTRRASWPYSGLTRRPIGLQATTLRGRGLLSWQDLATSPPLYVAFADGREPLKLPYGKSGWPLLVSERPDEARILFFDDGYASVSLSCE